MIIKARESRIYKSGWPVRMAGQDGRSRWPVKIEGSRFSLQRVESECRSPVAELGRSSKSG